MLYMQPKNKWMCINIKMIYHIQISWCVSAAKFQKYTLIYFHLSA
jgi:hypothetical protein